MNRTETDHINPFPGLRPFEPEEDFLFFGRDQQTYELLERLKRHRFLTVVGASGSGKSSLVRAGLLPSLYGGYMLEDGSGWRVAMFRPGVQPIRSLAEALAHRDVLGHEDQEVAAYQAIMLETTLRRGALGLIEVFEQSQSNPKGNLLIVVDQFEELFRYTDATHPSGENNEASAFVKLLLEAARSNSALYVVLTMRSDFLGDCSQFRDLPEAINEGQFLVPRMRRDQRRQAIEGPIAVGGAKITKRLVQRLLNDVGDNPDQLPILQHALMRTWNRWEAMGDPSAPLDFQHYEAIGEMGRALSQHGDEIYNELPDEQSRHIAETIFKRLTDRSQDARGVRRPTSLNELVDVSNANQEMVISVINAFRKPGRSLLMPPHETELKPDTQIDISHESLMRVWKRLNKWVDEEADSAKIYLRVAETALLHSEGHAGLWRDPDLQVALDWYAENKPTLAWAARYHKGLSIAEEFLEQSKQQRIEEQLEETARQKRELEQAQALAEEQRQRAEDQEASAKRLRRMVLLASLLAVLATLAAVIAIIQVDRVNSLVGDISEQNEELDNQRRIAEENAQTARANELQARESEARVSAYASTLDSLNDVLVDQIRISDENFELAQFQSEIASIRAAEAEEARNDAERQKEAAIRASDEANAASQEAVAAQREATRQLLQNLGVELSIGAVRLLDIGQTELGGLLALQAYRFDSLSGSEFRNEIFGAMRQSIAMLASDTLVSKVIIDGDRSRDFGVYKPYWYEEDGDKISLSLPDQEGDRFRVVAYSSAGSIAAGGDGGKIYYISSNDIYQMLPGPEGRTHKIAFNHDGTLFGSVSTTGILKLKAIVENSYLMDLDVPAGLENLSPFGLDSHLLSNLNDSSLLSIRSHQTIRDIEDFIGGQITSATYAEQGKVLVAGSAEGSLVIFREGSAFEVVHRIHEGAILDITLNPDETTIATAGVDFNVQLHSWPLSGDDPTLLPGHNSAVNALSFSPDGNLLASASSDRSIRLWNTQDSGAGIVILEGHDRWVWSVAFSPTGRQIISGSGDGTVRSWNIHLDDLSSQLCQLIDRPISREEWSTHIGPDISFDEYYTPCRR